uniref:ribosomal protein L22 n=1 Tax=Hormidiella parvula TaxID=2058785 RepID=UPI00286D507E|nr:ribosomal protein L22 [Hormidiella parvula]WKT06010.1 ribosomal protein L22 [Hormidiella parvula]
MTERTETNGAASAMARGVMMSPHKVRRVLDQVRGRRYEEALMILAFMPYRACEPVLKVVYSAAANAKHNLGLNKSRLFISEAKADEGPRLKRFQPRAQGRGFPIRKPTCNITIKVQESIE